MYICIFVMLSMLVYQFWIDAARDHLCHTFYFLLPAFINIGINMFFFYIGCKVMRTIKAFNIHQTALISPKKSEQLTSSPNYDEELASSQREIEHRRIAVRNMWTMIIVMLIVNIETTAYSFTLYIWSDNSCYVYETVWVRSLNTVLQRFIQYIIWMYPVFWLFWPVELSCRKKKAITKAKKDKSSRSYSTSETREEDSDNDDYSTPSNNSFKPM